jgi:hypothetical protein
MKRNRWTPNPNRLLWLNNGCWWMRWTPYDPIKTDRLAFNLNTRDVNQARRNRDEIVASWNRKEAA